MLIRPLTLLLVILAITACKRQIPPKSQEPGKPEVVRLSFKIDDIRRYPKPSGVYPDRFIFSPIDPADKVWTESHELDLLTGEWTALNNKFSVPYSVSIREEYIWTDSLTSNIYFNCCSRELMEYNYQNKTFRTLPVQYVHSFLAHQDFIFLGTPYGLFTYTRSADSVMRAKDFPQGISVYGIEALSDDSLRLGSTDEDIIYRIKDSRSYTTTRRSTPSYQDDSNSSAALPTSGSYRLVKDDSLTWMYHNADIYVKQGETIFHVTNLDSGYLRQLSADSGYLYLLFNHQFVVMNKAVAIQRAERFDAESYRIESNAIHWLNSQENLSLHQLISRIDSLQHRYGNSVHPDIRQRVLALNNSVGYAVYNDLLRPQIENSLQQGIIPEKFKRSVFSNLIQYYTREDNLDQVLRYYKQLRKTYPDEPESDPIVSVIRIKEKIDSIENLTLSPDKKLYLQTLEKQKLMQTGWFGESAIDDTIIADSYRKFLNAYPNSEYADNAAFYLLNHEYTSDEGMYFSSEAIADHEHFIKKYPRSELKINASFGIVEMCIAFSGESEAHFNILQKAKAELSRLNDKTMTESQKEVFRYYNSIIDSKLKELHNKMMR